MRIRGNSALHSLDRLLGIPAVAALGAFRRKRALPSTISTIGLLKGAAIGDTVLMGGIIADLRAAFPHAQLVLFVGETNYEMARMLSGVDRVVKAPAGNPLKGIRAMRSVSVDLMIDCGQWSRLEALYAISSKAAFRIGFRTSAQHRHYAFDVAIEHSEHEHELHNYRRLLGVLAPRTAHLPVLRSDSPDASASRRPYIVCHLWPGGRRKELKQWPIAHWIQLIKDFVNSGFPVVLTGGPSDGLCNQALLESLPPDVRAHVTSSVGADLRSTAALLSSARLVVSVDTGIMHLASALGTPLVSIHGPTSSKRWGPVSANAIAIDTPLPEGGYISLGWELVSPPPACMEAISYEAVLQACQRLLQDRRNNSTENHQQGAVEVAKAASY